MGMVPRAGNQPSLTEGFPRPRGDGPVLRSSAATEPEVSPPTWGWSPEEGEETEADKGFPAHAGMVPSSMISGNISVWFPRPRVPAHAGMVPWFAVPAKTIEGFPRPRGDGPVILVFISSQCAVSPPTRGWSCHMIVCTLLGDGFPAHAGMVPLFCLHGSGDVRFPRPRGDGPDRGTGMNVPAMVSPPTRGWSPRCLHSGQCLPGFPAHAGMVPRTP